MEDFNRGLCSLTGADAKTSLAFSLTHNDYQNKLTFIHFWGQ